jgi:hypothetical protein
MIKDFGFSIADFGLSRNHLPTDLPANPKSQIQNPK